MERDIPISRDASEPPRPEDRAVIDSAATEPLRDPEDRIPGTIDDDDALTMDVSAHPASETTAHTGLSDDEETVDGLSELEEAVRQQAEDRALGDDEDFRP